MELYQLSVPDMQQVWWYASECRADPHISKGVQSISVHVTQIRPVVASSHELRSDVNQSNPDGPTKD